MGLSLSGRGSVQRLPFVNGRTRQLQLLTRYINQMFRQEFPEFYFSSLQLNINARTLMHTDSANMGVSATVSMGHHYGGCLFTLAADGSPVIHDTACEPTLIDGRVPQCTLPFAGYRLVAVAFLHKVVFCTPDWQRDKLSDLGFRLPPAWMTAQHSFSTATFHDDDGTQAVQ